MRNKAANTKLCSNKLNLKQMQARDMFFCSSGWRQLDPGAGCTGDAGDGVGSVAGERPVRSTGQLSPVGSALEFRPLVPV